MKIGVFDSGVGGKSVANAIKKSFKEHEIILREDKKNLPYGTKSKTELFILVSPIILEMVDEGCQLIVIACNTVTTNLIAELREISKVPLIGIEPMLKPASKLTKTNSIAVFATPMTLNSGRYKWLKENYCNNVAVYEPDCSKWATMIEGSDIQVDQIEKNVKLALDNNADVIVLGCTHYHWIQDLVHKIADGKAKVIQPEDAIVSRVSTMLEQLN